MFWDGLLWRSPPASRGEVSVCTGEQLFPRALMGDARRGHRTGPSTAAALTPDWGDGEPRGHRALLDFTPV